jgi:hypothetical protein
MTKNELKKLIREMLSEEVVNFDELKKHQETIRKEQDYLLKISKELGVDNKLVGNFNQSLNALLDAIFKAQK